MLQDYLSREATNLLFYMFVHHDWFLEIRLWTLQRVQLKCYPQLHSNILERLTLSSAKVGVTIWSPSLIHSCSPTFYYSNLSLVSKITLLIRNLPLLCFQIHTFCDLSLSYGYFQCNGHLRGEEQNICGKRMCVRFKMCQLPRTLDYSIRSVNEDVLLQIMLHSVLTQNIRWVHRDKATFCSDVQAFPRYFVIPILKLYIIGRQYTHHFVNDYVSFVFTPFLGFAHVEDSASSST